MGYVIWLLIRDLPGRAATVARIAIPVYAIFYAVYEAMMGIATGIMTQHGNGMTGAERDGVAEAVNAIPTHAIVGDGGLLSSIGSLAWIVAITGAILALRAAGVRRSALVLLGIGTFMAMHVPPIGPIALVCLSGAAFLIERHREAPAQRRSRTAGRRARCRVDRMTATAPARPASPTRVLARAARAISRAGSLFRLGIAVIALHVLDDNFVQPESGTLAARPPAQRHWPLAVLGLAAWAYPRLRGGRRGAMALLFGLSGIVAGVEALHCPAGVGVSGDDFTGLLAMPAGLGLLGLGTTTLWSTRRRRAAARGATCAGRCSAPQRRPVVFVVAPLSGRIPDSHLGRAVVPRRTSVSTTSPSR